MEKDYMLKTGRRTYFFNVQESETKRSYINITESKRIAEGYQRHNIILDAKHLDAFISQLKEIQNDFRIATGKAYSLDDIRETYPNAYEKWDDDQDDLLTRLFCEGQSITEIAERMQRQPGAIRSRIRKLELNEKYGL